MTAGSLGVFLVYCVLGTILAWTTVYVLALLTLWIIPWRARRKERRATAVAELEAQAAEDRRVIASYYEHTLPGDGVQPSIRRSAIRDAETQRRRPIQYRDWDPDAIHTEGFHDDS